MKGERFNRAEKVRKKHKFPGPPCNLSRVVKVIRYIGVRRCARDQKPEADLPDGCAIPSQMAAGLISS